MRSTAPKRPYWIPAAQWLKGTWQRPRTLRGAEALNVQEREGEVVALHHVLSVVLFVRRAIFNGLQRRVVDVPGLEWGPHLPGALAILSAAGDSVARSPDVRGVLELAHEVASKLAVELLDSVAQVSVRRKRPPQFIVNEQFLKGFVPVIFQAAFACAVIADELAEPRSPPVQPVTVEDGVPLPFFPPSVERGFLAELHTADLREVVSTALHWLTVVESRIRARQSELIHWRRGPATKRGTRDRRVATKARGRPRQDGGALSDDALQRLVSDKMREQESIGKPASASAVLREIAEHQLRDETNGRVPATADVKRRAAALKKRLARRCTSTTKD